MAQPAQNTDSVIAVSKKQFANEKYNPLYMNIRKEGVTV